MKYAWNITNVSDLRDKPDNNSERISQLLFSEIVGVLKEQGSFVRVRQFDGYEGWVYNPYLKKISVKEAKSFLKLPKYVLTSNNSKTYNNKGDDIPPYNIFYGTVISVKSRRQGKTNIVLPDESTIHIKGNRFRPIDDNNRHEITGTRLVREAKKFLGIPYLWGGVTPLGYDCSGLIQAVFRSFGIILPRDTKDQIESGKPIARNCIKTGDLMFFNRHVGIAIGKTKLIHASRHSGGVRIESLVKNEDNYREDLANTFVQARRII